MGVCGCGCMCVCVCVWVCDRKSVHIWEYVFARVYVCVGFCLHMYALYIMQINNRYKFI